MKKIAMFLALICLLAWGSGPARVSAGEWVSCILFCMQNGDPDGFRQILWGTDISSLGDMVYSRTDPNYGGVAYFQRNQDPLEIGDAAVTNIAYGFWRGKFSEVVIEAKGFANYVALKQACYDRFGMGYQPDWREERFYWSGPLTTMYLQYSETYERTTLFIYSKEIYDLQRAAERKAKEEAARGQQN